MIYCVCYNAQVKNQVFPLCGASVYPYVKRTGEVTHAKDPGMSTPACSSFSSLGFGCSDSDDKIIRDT